MKNVLMLGIRQWSISVVVVTIFSTRAASFSPANTCNAGIVHPFDSASHQKTYTVGVLANRGEATAYADFNTTFGDYLTATAGRRFTPPIKFQMRPLSFHGIFQLEGIDFTYVNPSAYSCIDSEYGAQSLVTQISRRIVGGKTYDLTQFGGVIIALKNATGIETVSDLKDKKIAAVSISGLGSGQMQFLELQKAGLSYINDPKQIVFTGTQGKIVEGVLRGDFDVGLIRTDQLERSAAASTDEKEFLEQFKIINMQQPPPVLEDGQTFPFGVSTSLVPEWNFAALNHVHQDVSRAVQEAMTALSEHAQVFQTYQQCSIYFNDTFCKDLPFPNEVARNVTGRCDTSREVAQIAHKAMQAGKYAGWRTTLSYMDLRSMQDATGFIHFDHNVHQWRCVRSVELYDAITCPAGYFRKSQEQVESGCAEEGLNCEEGMFCLCRPCKKGFDVDIIPIMETSIDSVKSSNRGCSKMSICGRTQQTKALTILAEDNLKRRNITMNVILHTIESSKEVDVNYDLANNYTYEFTLRTELDGVWTYEIFVNGEQIPESPLRVLVEERSCDVEFGPAYEAAISGNCVCKRGYITMGKNKKCVDLYILLAAIFIPLCLLVVTLSYYFAQVKRREADKTWKIDPNDIKFSKPNPFVIGQGRFGEVLLAEFHGTSVAVKRVIHPHRIPGSDNDSTTKSVHRDSLHGDLESAENGSEGKGHETAISFDDEMKKVPSKRSSLGLLSGYEFGSAIGTYSPSSSMYAKPKTDFIKEMRLLSTLRHPSITTIIGAIVNRRDSFLVMEYCEHGTLYSLLQNESFILEGELLLPILRDIAQGIRFLHSTKPTVIHGDLKSHNILIGRGFRAKITNCGFVQKKKNTIATGTPYWMAPELLRCESKNSTASDVYATGMILYELYSRKEPYEGELITEVLKGICDPEVNKRPVIPASCPVEITALIKSCWEGDPAKRPSAEELDEGLKLFRVENVQHVKRGPSGCDAAAPKTASNYDFIYNVFPKHIADKLVKGEKVEPESHDCVTIFFSDICGFTQIASTSNPLKISDLLDRLYLALDDLSEKHALYKIETIGDAYMAVANLNEDQANDHVKRVAEFALDAAEAASKIPIDVDDPSKGFIEIRMGFHSGPVVANVVGSLNPRFGLFGDTVNTASRMESSSKPGVAHCSDASARLLMEQAPDIQLKCRGKIQVKGKGEMSTYFVRGKVGEATQTKLELGANSDDPVAAPE